MSIRPLRSRVWKLFALAIALAAGHLVLFHFLRRSGAAHISLPSALVVGIVLLIAAKHLGLLAVFVRSFRRRP